MRRRNTLLPKGLGEKVSVGARPRVLWQLLSSSEIVEGDTAPRWILGINTDLGVLVMDQVIHHRVAAILTEMGLNRPVSYIEDFDPNYCCKNIGSHRLYEFHLEIRDDVDPDNFIADFCAALDEYNKTSIVKAAFYGANEYPGPVKNWTTVYLTVAAI